MINLTMRQAAIDAIAKSSRRTLHLETISGDTLLSVGGLGLSSVGLLQTLVILEERFGITFDDAAVLDAKFDTFNDFVLFLEIALSGNSREAST
jgi:acyl carrier protein